MTIRNLHWSNQNAGIAYPVDESATAVDNNGINLPSNIIVDLNLRWPVTLGRYAFLSSVSVTKNLVTCTILAANATNSADDFVPLAVISLAKPIINGIVYALQAQANGVGGWIVFGSGANDVSYIGRFHSPSQALLAPRAARAYNPLPVSSLGVLYNSSNLTGAVKLLASSPLEAVKETREIDGTERDVIVIRLVESNGVTSYPVPAAAAALLNTPTSSIFYQYAGPCASRPESNTCTDPQPMEFINGVAPDCNGMISLVFQGCSSVSQIVDECGIVVDCNLGLIDACLPPQLPNSEGLLPSDYVPTNVPPPAPSPEPPPESILSESFVIVGELPYCQSFISFPSDFVIEVGVFEWVEDDVPAPYDDPCDLDAVYSTSFSISGSSSSSYSAFNHYNIGSIASVATGTWNLIVWDGFDITTFYRKVTASVKLLEGPGGISHNAGIVVNYKPDESIAGQETFYLIQVDYDAQVFQVAYFNGTSLQPIIPVIIPDISLNEWYVLTASILPAPNAGATITARLESLTSVGVIDITITVVVNGYLPSNGLYGLCTNRAISHFGYFKVEEVN